MLVDNLYINIYVFMKGIYRLLIKEVHILKKDKIIEKY